MSDKQDYTWFTNKMSAQQKISNAVDSCPYEVYIRHPNVSVCLLYGSSDITQAKQVTLNYQGTPDAVIKGDLGALPANSMVWVFTFLRPVFSPPQGWLYKFGVDAGESGLAAQMGINQAAGNADTLPAGLGTIPGSLQLPDGFASPKLSSPNTQMPPSSNVWEVFEMRQGIHVEARAHVFLLSDSNEIYGNWSGYHNVNSTTRFGTNAAGNFRFFCCVNPSPAIEGEPAKGFHFHVGDPKKDARVVLPGM